jgi:hypothetical protein
MKATIAHTRYAVSGRGWLELSRREALVVSCVLASLTVYLTALLLLV